MKEKEQSNAGQSTIDLKAALDRIAALEKALESKGSGLNDDVMKGIVAISTGSKAADRVVRELKEAYPDRNIKSTFGGAALHYRQALKYMTAAGIKVDTCKAVDVPDFK